MARASTWAIRVTGAYGRGAFVRVGGVFGKGPIATFYSREKADAEAASVRASQPHNTVEVIERSHGRRF